MQSSSQRAAPASSTPESSGFAGFLSALTSAASSPGKTQWNDDALADDVATLSYESALKAHSRYRPAAEPLAEVAAATRPMEAKAQDSTSIAEPMRKCLNLRAGEPKSTSITVRMSQAECAQLKQRAAEAGMTISAYLRSCTFEAEALRGQVKEALAGLRAAASANDKKQASPNERRKRSDWLSRILSRSGARDQAGVN
jgi:predicted DNA binding CopG/RHH family protein